MRSTLGRKYRDVGSQQEERTHTGKTEDEEDWGRVKTDGGGRGAREDGRRLHLVKPIVGVIAQLRRRKLWARMATSTTDANPPIMNSSTTVSSSLDSTVQPSAVTPTFTDISIYSDTGAVLTSSPVPLPTPSDTPPITGALPTITSTITYFAPNGTTIGQTTRTPITASGTVIVFTTPSGRNRTASISVMSSGSTTDTHTTLSTTTTSATTAIASNDPDYPAPVPQPTELVITTTVPTSTPTVTNDTTNQPVVEPSLLGGIFGGVAGIAIVLLAVFMLIKRYKRIRAVQALDDAGYGGPLEGAPAPSMVQRSLSFLGAGALAQRHKSPVVMSQDPAEQGFKKLSGRKLPPAIGGSRPEFGSVRSNAQSSYYTGDDSLGPSGTPRSSTQGPGRFSTTTTHSNGPTNPFNSPPSSPIGIPGPSRFRDSTDSRLAGSSATPPRPPPPLRTPIFNRQLSLTGSDGVGRSLASHDGSRGSRFTEDIT